MVNPKKVRFDGLDCAAITSQIRSTLLGSKVANIYDGQSSSSTSSNSNNTSTYLLKLVQPSAENSKFFLLIESGVRFHITEAQTRSGGTGAMPSPFAMKLRKCLNNRRLESVTQLGNLDRVVDLRFGSGTEGSFHLLLEFYAKGNIILTSHNYEILALLRSHEYTDTQTSDKGDKADNDGKQKNSGEVKVAVGQVYPVTFATTLGSVSTKLTADKANEQTETEKLPDSILDMNADQAFLWFQNEAIRHTNYKLGQQNDTKKKKKKKNNNSFTLKMALLKPTSGVYHYGPSLLDHCILSSGLDPTLALNCIYNEETENEAKSLFLDPKVLSHDQLSLLLSKLKQDASEIIESLTTTSHKEGEKKGYILYQPFKETDKEDTDEKKKNSRTHSDKLFLEFQPHLLEQHTNPVSSKHGNVQILKYDTFSQAVDNFFSHLDSQKRAVKASNLQASAQQKLVNIQADQNARMEALENELAGFYEDAQWIEQNAEIIDDCLTVVNSALDSGMNWDDLESLVEVEQQNGNNVALLIHALDLKNDVMILKLRGIDGEETRNVRVNLEGGAHQNARMKYEQYRQWKDKAAKTQEANKKALEAAETTVKKQLMEVAKTTRGISMIGQLGMSSAVAIPERKPFWFEKFHWFITSDNYLVLAGKDAHQNETLVKRYLRPGDAYLHADVFGASSCILRAKRRRVNRSSGKNKKQYSTQVLPLSEQALREAGHFTICHSSAWSTKMITSAWYVEAHQVSKTAPSGEYLTVGSFMVRGKKNYLQPVQLEMGLGVLFTLGDTASIASHRGERRDFALIEDDDNDVSDSNVQNNNESKDTPHVKQIKEISSESEGEHASVKAEEKGKIVDDYATENENAISSPRDITEENEKSLKVVSSDEEDHTTNECEKAREEPDKSENLLEEVSRIEDDTNGSSEGMTIETSKPNSEVLPKKKKGISVKERRLIKKYGSLEKAEIALAEANAKKNASSSNSISKETSESKKSKPSQQTNQPSRGKKNKAKRIAKKYADQDEEDRELAILALHGEGEGKQGKKDKKAKKKSSSNVAAHVKSTLQIKAAEETLALLLKDTAEVADRLPKEVRDILASCVSVSSSNNTKEDEEIQEKTIVRWEKFDADVLEKLEALEKIDAQLAAVKRLHQLTQSTRVDNFAASLAGILRTIDRFGYENLVNEDDDDADQSKSRKSRADKEAEKEAWRKILAEDGTLLSDDENADEDEAIDDTAELAKLTAKPSSEDVILGAVPVCAPYHTLSQYKYRVKLTPGSLKRGKAAKQCVELLCKGGNDKDEGEKRNIGLVKLISHNELVQSICGDVKIAAPGASKLIKNNKKNSGKNKGAGKKKK